jgi:hypothetical protein
MVLSPVAASAGKQVALIRPARQPQRSKRTRLQIPPIWHPIRAIDFDLSAITILASVVGPEMRPSFTHQALRTRDWIGIAWFSMCSQHGAIQLRERFGNGTASLSPFLV